MYAEKGNRHTAASVLDKHTQRTTTPLTFVRNGISVCVDVWMCVCVCVCVCVGGGGAGKILN